MKHDLQYNIKPLDSGFVLEVYQGYFNFFYRRKEQIAFSSFQQLLKYIKDVGSNQVELWCKVKPI